MQPLSVYRFWECVDFGGDDFSVALQDGQSSHLNQPGFHPTLICKRYSVGIPTELANPHQYRSVRINLGSYRSEVTNVTIERLYPLIVYALPVSYTHLTGMEDSPSD